MSDEGPAQPVTPTRHRCPVCHGWGYIPCDCWPGDCLCGDGDEDCEACHGTGDRDAADPGEDYP